MADLTLLEKLRQIEACKKPGDPLPPFLADHTNDWLDPLSTLAKEAADALEHKDRLQTLYDDLMAGYDRLRADTDAAIKARCGENWETIRPLLAQSSKHARSIP